MDGMKSFGLMGKMGGLGFAVMGDGDFTPELMDTLMKAAMAMDDDECDDDDDDDDYPSGCCPSESCDYHLHCSRCDNECESAHFDKRWKHMTGDIDAYLCSRDDLEKDKDGYFKVLLKPEYPYYARKHVIEVLSGEPRNFTELMHKIQRLIEDWEDSVEGEYIDDLADDIADYLACLRYEVDDEDYYDIEEYIFEKVDVTVDQECLLSLAFMES